MCGTLSVASPASGFSSRHGSWAILTCFPGSNGICGALIAISALAAYYRTFPAEELVKGVVALWVFASPWVVGPGAIPATLAWSNWITAAITVFAARWGVIRPSDQPSQVAARRKRRSASAIAKEVFGVRSVA
jgi:hypothetical protein